MMNKLKSGREKQLLPSLAFMKSDPTDMVAYIKHHTHTYPQIARYDE